jgi:copper chaperone CopZ
VARRFIVKIAGMNAVHAVRAVETALGGLLGVLRVDAALGEVVVTHDGRLTPTPLRQAVETAGFVVSDLIEDRRHRLPLIE